MTNTSKRDQVAEKALKKEKTKRMVLFGLLLGIFATSLHILQYFTLPLLYLHSHRLFRKFNTIGVSVFCSIIVVLTWLFAPIELVLTGDYASLLQEDKMLLLANHQIYTDWWYLWILSWYANRQYFVKIILKESLKYLPVFGPGMMFFEFIFLKRKWAFDKVTFKKALSTIQSDNLPFWLIIFPEGTVITAETKEKAYNHAKKVGWTEEPQLVLHPKSRGTFFVCKHLRGYLSSVYDVTMAYSGLKEQDCPYDEYPIDKIFFENKGPKRVYLHVKKFPLSEIPGFTIGDIVDGNGSSSSAESLSGLNDNSFIGCDDINSNGNLISESVSEQKFGKWLRTRYMEKDKILRQYHKTGQLVENESEEKPSLCIHVTPTAEDFIALFTTVYISFCIMKYVITFFFF